MGYVAISMHIMEWCAAATAAHTTRRGPIEDVVNSMQITQWCAAATAVHTTGQEPMGDVAT